MKRNLVTGIFCCLAGACFAQADLSDSADYGQAVRAVIGSYYRLIGENDHLYNGSEYVGFNYKPDNNPYFESTTNLIGSIRYDGLLFTDIPLTYDVARDEVIIDRYQQHYRIKLISEKIDSFDIPGHRFVRVVEDSLHKSLMGTGFYDQLYSGNLFVFAKRRKPIIEKMISNIAVSQYTEFDHYFIKKDGIWHPVQTKQSVLKLLKEKKNDIQKLLRKNKIKFKKNAEDWIVKAATYYDQTKN